MGTGGTLDSFVYRAYDGRCSSKREAPPESQICVHGRGRSVGESSRSESQFIPANKKSQPNGFYGTSVKLNWALDPYRGIMLAYKMNGEPLRPDHGRPLRAVVPGQIGGRSVKWLTKLILTDEPSDNWYHINDNRVLP